MAKAAKNNGSVGKVVVIARHSIHHSQASQADAGAGGQSGNWCVLVARGAGSSVAIESAVTVPGDDQAGLIAAILRSKADVLVSVIPASKLVVRATLASDDASRPGSDAGAIVSAMDLVAEATLGSSAEAHRRGAGIVKLGGTSQANSAAMTLVVGWIGGAEDGHPSQMRELGPLGKACTWVPEAAALGALAAATPGCAVAISTNRDAGSILSLAAGPSKVAARSLNEDGEDAAQWHQAVDESAGRASAAVEVAPPRGTISTSGRVVVLVNAQGERLTGPAVQGATLDDRWMSDFGIALGATIAMLKGDALSRPLLGMSLGRPIPHVPPLLKVVDFFSRPARAVTALAACAALALFWPLGVAWARQRVLEDKAKLVGSDDGSAQDARRQADFYQLLKKKRWPMTKLLGDLTAGLPPGITLETLTLEYGQKLRVSGVADSAQVVSQWREALDKSSVFDKASVPKNEATTSSGSFELTARVAQPLFVAGSSGKPALSALVITVPTEETANPAAPAANRSAQPAAGESGKSSGAATRSDRPATGAGRASGNRNNAAKGDKPAADAVPPALSDEEIGQLDHSAALREWAARKKAIGSVNDAGDVDRLKGEIEKLNARMQATKGGGQ